MEENIKFDLTKDRKQTIDFMQLKNMDIKYTFYSYLSTQIKGTKIAKVI